MLQEKKSLLPKIKKFMEFNRLSITSKLYYFKKCFSITPSYTNFKVFVYLRSKLSLRSLYVSTTNLVNCLIVIEISPIVSSEKIYNAL